MWRTNFSISIILQPSKGELLSAVNIDLLTFLCLSVRKFWSVLRQMVSFSDWPGVCVSFWTKVWWDSVLSWWKI